MDFDLTVIGAGPGGYCAAIRATQLGMKVAIIEEDKLGGVCLNRGCIPTKALLKSAHSVHQLKEMRTLGIDVELKGLNPSKAVKRAGQISSRISKGVGLLMKKNSIEVIEGRGVINGTNEIMIGEKKITTKNILIATGAHYRTFPGLEHDGERLIGAWEALKLEELPESMAIIGAGAIGIEMAYFWNAFGVKVHIFEVADHILPLEDQDSSTEVERAYKRLKISFSLGVNDVKTHNNGDSVTISYKEKDQEKSLQFDKALIAVGMVGNIENIGLENIGIETNKNFIKVNNTYQTNIENIYAIGDVSGPPLLAHVATHEGIIAVEHMNGINPHKLNKNAIPGCIYSYPQVASVGMTEQQIKDKKLDYKVGKLPFMANGKALASNEKSGFVKILLDNNNKILGAHIVGDQATELIHEYNLIKNIDGSAQDIINTIHPHPTMGEWLQEAVLASLGRPINY